MFTHSATGGPEVVRQLAEEKPYGEHEQRWSVDGVPVGFHAGDGVREAAERARRVLLAGGESMRSYQQANTTIEGARCDSSDDDRGDLHGYVISGLTVFTRTQGGYISLILLTPKLLS